MSRLFAIFGVAFLLPVTVIFQIVRIQTTEGENLKALWNAQAIDFITIPAERGRILDRHGNVLVSNTVRYSVAVDPLVPNLEEALLDSVCLLLARATQKPIPFYKEKIKRAPRGSRYVMLARDLSPHAYESIAALRFRGLIVDEQYKRRYNYDSLAAHVVGFVNADLRGMIGLENSFNEQLRGQDGLQQVQRDRHHNIRAIVGAPRKRPEQGMDLVTTLDLNIQAIVEEELRNGVRRNLAKQGTAIVMIPETGEVVAMANYPTFNPNKVGVEGENRRNFAIADMVEPGSTFKLVTALAAVEQDAVNFTEIFETPKNGRKLVHGQWLRDHDPLGNLTFQQVIQKSSNIATADIAMRLDKELLYQYARNLGFSTPTNIELPNESPGVLRRPHQWSNVSQSWVAMGYEVQVTPLQMLQAYTAFANGGRMMRPNIVRDLRDDMGRSVQHFKPTFVRKIARAETIQKLLPVFESVVTDSGTASYAQLKSIQVAGKTGTAQKFIDGKYRAKYRASFVGFFPSREPKYSILVLLEEPRTSIYGGFTAGSIFRRIAERIVGMDPDINIQAPEFEELLVSTPNFRGHDLDKAKYFAGELGLRVEVKGEGDVVLAQNPAFGDSLAPGQAVSFTAGSYEDFMEENGRVLVPDVAGLSLREATKVMFACGLDIKTIGSGTVFAQYPKAGTTMRKGSKITLRGRSRSLEAYVEAKR